jgi:hypothetical protein
MVELSPSAAAYRDSYRPAHNLPPLVGLGTFAQAMKPGLSVEESVSRLKRHHYALRRLHQIFLARLTAEPLYELKMAFSYHAYLCSEIISALRDRVGEMREPPLGLDRLPHPQLEIFFDEILCAPNTALLLAGIYQSALPMLLEGLARHADEAHVLADQPTRRLCQQAIHDLEEVATYGKSAVQSISCDDDSVAEFLQRLSTILALAGGMDGTLPAETTSTPTREFSLNGFHYDARPQRDERFPDPYNMGVNAEALLYDEKKPPNAKVLMMFYKRLREIDVPEMMASIITETPDKPWDYYRDMTRQLWDEARHAMMGEVGFVSLGLDWPKLVMVNHTWSLALNSQLTPKERHAVLYFIEQGLMPKSGKRHEWEVAIMAENSLASTFQDFDWADEVLHARIGRDWYVSDMASPAEAIGYGDACWNKVLLKWRDFMDSGLTAHRNWWPELYANFCKNTGQTGDPETAAFHTTYEKTRADLKNISGSA